MVRVSLLCICLLLSPLACADSPVYCPGKHGYISVGMTQAQVLSACGQPTTKRKTNGPLVRKVPVVQLIYNNIGTAKAFYGVWSLPVGLTAGVTLEIDVVDNKVYSVQVGSESAKAMSICSGVPILKGDPVSKVYGACGNPSAINDTYITQEVSSVSYPEVWTYETPYQGTMRLTFLKGQLESID